MRLFSAVDPFNIGDNPAEYRGDRLSPADRCGEPAAGAGFHSDQRRRLLLARPVGQRRDDELRCNHPRTSGGNIAVASPRQPAVVWRWRRNVGADTWLGRSEILRLAATSSRRRIEQWRDFPANSFVVVEFSVIAVAAI